MLPYFQRPEDNERFHNDYHGSGGPLGVSDPVRPLPISAAFLRAAQQAGLPFNPDFNGAVQDGCGYYQVGPHIAGVAVRQIEDEEVRLARDTPDHRTRLAEVRLPMAGWMDQRHEHLPPPAVVLAHIVLHDPDRVRNKELQDGG